jgi:hypothetical protein
MLSVTFAGVILTAAWAGEAVSQPVTTIAEVVGKWSGVGSRGGKTDIEIEPTGRFTSKSPAGMQSGLAKIEDGFLVLPFSSNQGQIKFTRTKDSLEGPYVMGTMTGTVRVERVGK